MDVPEYWATESIEWASENGIVEGTGSGNFSPYKTLTEAEFITMLIRMAKLTTRTPISGEHWSQPYYDVAREYSIPLNGYANTSSGNAAKNKPITRGEVAKIVAAKYGFNLNLEQAVLFMYKNDLSNGMAETRSYESYGVNLSLKRDQAAAFMQRINNKKETSFDKSTVKTNGIEIVGITGKAQSEIEIRLEEYSYLVPLLSGKMWNGMYLLSHEQREIKYHDYIYSYMIQYRTTGKTDPAFIGKDGIPDFSLKYGMANAAKITPLINMDPRAIRGYMSYNDPRLYELKAPLLDIGVDGKYFIAKAMPWQDTGGYIAYNPANPTHSVCGTMAQVNALLDQWVPQHLNTKTTNFLYNTLNLCGKLAIDTNLERVKNTTDYDGIANIDVNGKNLAPTIYGFSEVTFYDTYSDYGISPMFDAYVGIDEPSSIPVGLVIVIEKRQDKPVDWGDYMQYFGGQFLEICFDKFEDKVTMFKPR